jgi:uncharacterized membrane protein HdeD (DUF308 family)
MNLSALVRNWWMMAIRGVLAMAFGVSIVVWPGATLSTVVLLFSVYAILDGAWTIGAGTRASTGVFDAWPVLLEGAVSVGLGLVALAWPFVPRQFAYVLAAWGLITGVLELVAAIRLPRSAAGHWLLATAGVSSLLLAALVLLLAHADDDFIMRAIAAYALVFGTVLLLAAVFFPREVLSGERTTRSHRCEPLTNRIV